MLSSFSSSAFLLRLGKQLAAETPKMMRMLYVPTPLPKHVLIKNLANGSKPNPRKILSSKADCSSLEWALSEALSFLNLNQFEARCHKVLGLGLEELPGIVSGQTVKSEEWSLLNLKPELTFDMSTFQFKELLKSLSCVPLSSTVWADILFKRVCLGM